MNDDRMPPHNIDAEEAVIGSLLIDSESMYEISTFLKSEDFYREKNLWAYEACLSLYERNEPVNQVTLAHELAQKGRLEALGGAAYLSHLVSEVPTSVHIEYYAQIVHRMAMMRRLIEAGGKISAIGYEDGSDVDAALDKAEGILFSLRRGQIPRDFVHIRSILDQYFEESGLTPRAQGEEIPHIDVGFDVLDDLLGGFQRSDLIILGARPSLGKTSLALNIARNAAVHQNAHVAIFSLEMSKEQLVQRLLACESGVDVRRVRLGLHDEQEEKRIMDATGLLSEAPIYVDDSSLPSIGQIRSKARRLQQDKGIDFIVVDYLQLVQGDGGFEKNRVQEMSRISQQLKGLARDLNVPVLSISQLSRAAEQRAEHVPQLSDLRESGSIEQDADVVIFIHREDRYVKREDWERRYPDKPYPKGIADIIVAKHRNGPVGSVNLEFLEKTTKFRSLARERK